MKKLLTLTALLICSCVIAQTPQAVNYQGIARDLAGTPLINQPLGVELTIHSGSPTGTIVYQETFTPTTNQFGLYTAQMGMGTPVSGTFSSISWGTSTYFLEVGMDITGGNAYVAAGTTQLISVPYALYAETSGSSTPGPVGPTGANGVTGATGPSGDPGINGTNGTNGATGATGLTGAAGTNGATGATGATGAAGTNGTNGATGATGAAGTNGTNGATGATGAAGTNGTNGATGATGAAGTNGTNGATGATGAAGTNGTNGATGATGAAGTNGTNGATGATGLTGSTGAAGTNGTNGATGPTGLTGANGAVGATGPSGANGTNGAAGATGATGATGVTGATGFLSNGLTAGNTPYWNGSSWVTNSSNIFNNGGRIGIGNTSPSAKLHVGAGTRFTLPDTGSIFLQSGNGIGSARDWKIYVSMPNGYLGFRDMGFDNSNNGMATDAMAIQWGTGNVGINTTAPTEKLHILGASNADVMAKVEAVGNSGSANFTAKGSASSTDVFEMSKYNVAAAGTVAGVPLANLSLLYAGAGAGRMLFDVINSNPMQFATSNTVRMTIENTGNIGVGTTTPAAMMDVNGTAKIGTNGTVVNAVIKNTQNVDLPSIAPTGGVLIQTFTVANAVIGGAVYISPDQALPNGVIIAYARVSAANTVEVKFYNAALIANDPPAMNWNISIVQ